MSTTPQTLDVSGLPHEAVWHLKALAERLRLATTPVPPLLDPMGPSAEEWAARLRAFCAAQPWQHVHADDSRESIYGDR